MSMTTFYLVRVKGSVNKKNEEPFKRFRPPRSLERKMVFWCFLHRAACQKLSVPCMNRVKFIACKDPGKTVFKVFHSTSSTSSRTTRTSTTTTTSVLPILCFRYRFLPVDRNIFLPLWRGLSPKQKAGLISVV